MKLVIKPNETTIINQVIKIGSFLQNLRIKRIFRYIFDHFIPNSAM